jgi:hypothetical protein
MLRPSLKFEESKACTILARATSYQIGQKQQTKLVITNPVGAADSAYIAEKQCSFCRDF